MNDSLDADELISWFQQKKRDLPWRQHISPYAVWISEVMLQQTQVSVVIPYFERWMQRFPTVQDLAAATLDEVIKFWEGLGYYSRARNLHEGAKTLCEKFDANLPQTERELSTIKGLGPYTIGAIQSFAFHKKAAAVDGNVLRVMARYFEISEDIAKAATVKSIRNIVYRILPEDKHWIVNEALIEIGATICTKKPSCNICPLKKKCKCFLHGTTDEIPISSKKTKTIPINRAVGAITASSCFLVRRGKAGEIMHDLYEFPFFEINEKKTCGERIAKIIRKTFGLPVKWIKELTGVSHTFTKYRACLHPHLFSADAMPEIEGYTWMTLPEMHEVAFSSGHKKILQEL